MTNRSAGAGRDGKLREQIAELIEVEERACRQKEHDATTHHARSVWGASATTCGLLAAQVRQFAVPAPLASSSETQGENTTTKI